MAGNQYPGKVITPTPAPHEIHYFYIQGQSGQLYEVFGYKYSDHALVDVLVVCAIARLA